MPTVFTGMLKDELLETRIRLRNRILAGSQTGVALAPGMRDDFAEKTEKELRALLNECNFELYTLDPDNYANPYASKRMTVVSSYRL